MPAPKPNTSDSDRYWARRAHRIKAGWPEHMLDAPPAVRTNRDALYHKTIDMIYENPSVTSRDIADLMGVSKDDVLNALSSRHTKITELRAEALEDVRF